MQRPPDSNMDVGQRNTPPPPPPLPLDLQGCVPQSCTRGAWRIQRVGEYCRRHGGSSSTSHVGRKSSTIKVDQEEDGNYVNCSDINPYLSLL